MSKPLLPMPRRGDLLIVSDQQQHPEKFLLADATSGRLLALPFDDFQVALQCAQVLAEPRKLAIWREIPLAGTPVLLHRPL